MALNKKEFSMSSRTYKTFNMSTRTSKNFSFMINNFKIGLLLSQFDPQTLGTLDTEILRDMDYLLL